MTIPKAERRFWVARGFKDPLSAYRQHKASAKQRGIPFQLSPAEWWDLWAARYHQRGSAPADMCMCRTGDAGPYALGNVRIDTVRNNLLEAASVRRRRAIQAAWGSEVAPLDWMDGRCEATDPLEMLMRMEAEIS